MKMSLIVLTAVLFSLVSEAWTQDCSFNPTETSPYIVDENYNFPSTLRFGPDDLLYIACPKGTFSAYLAEEGDHVVCKGGTSILNIRTIEVLDFKNIECKSTTFPTSVQNSNEKCGSNSTLIDVGYKIYRGFVSVISVCFNQVKLTPFYAKCRNAYYSGKALTANLNYSLYDDLFCPGGSGNCPFLDSGGFFAGINMDNIYLNQKQILQNLGVNVNDNLLKFPLAVNGFPFTQQVENYPFWDYINIAPMWNVIHDLWVYLFDVLSSGTTNAFFYIGTLGVATLPNTLGSSVELYLSNNQVPVPKWFWIVYEDTGDVAVLFYYNSPVEFKDSDRAEICKEWGNVAENVILCYPESITDPEIKTFLANTYCKNKVCETRGYIDVTNFKLRKN